MTVKVPAAAVDAALIVNVELLPAVTEVGLKEAVTPEGNPEALKEMLCALPETTAVEIVEFPEEPAAMVKEDGLAEMEKSFATVRETMQLLAVLENTVWTT